LESENSCSLNFKPEALDFPGPRIEGAVCVLLPEAGNGHWHKNFYRALYRIVLSGAVLSKVYNEPLFSAVETDAIIAPRLVKNYKWREKHSWDILNYIRQFPVYNSNADQYEHAFEPLAKWLVGNGETRCVREGLKRIDESEQASTIREIVHLLVAYEHLTNKIVNGNPDWNFGRHQLNKQGVSCGDFRGEVDAGPRNDFPSGVRKVSVCSFGVFQVEDISLPIRVEDMTWRYLFADPCDEVQREGKLYPGTMEISPTSFWDIQGFLRRTRVDVEGPPAALLQFFSFIHEDYLDCKFTEDAFGDPADPYVYSWGPFYSLGWPRLFCNGEWGGNLVDHVDYRAY
jgi:hypothetical protein